MARVELKDDGNNGIHYINIESYERHDEYSSKEAPRGQHGGSTLARNLANGMKVIQKQYLEYM